MCQVPYGPSRRPDGLQMVIDADHRVIKIIIVRVAQKMRMFDVHLYTKKGTQKTSRNIPKKIGTFFHLDCLHLRIDEVASVDSEVAARRTYWGRHV